MEKHKLLSVLEFYPNGVGASELSSKYGESLPSLGMDLKRLCEQGLAQRTRVSSYPLRYDYFLSPKGRQLLQKEREKAVETTKGIQEGKGIDTFLVLGGAALVAVLGCLVLMPNLWEKVKAYFPGPPKEEEEKIGPPKEEEEKIGPPKEELKIVLPKGELEAGRIYRITYDLKALTTIFRIHQAVRPGEYLSQFTQTLERSAPWLHIIKFEYTTVSGFFELSRVVLTCAVINVTPLAAIEVELNAVQKDYRWTTSQIEELQVK